MKLFFSVAAVLTLLLGLLWLFLPATMLTSWGGQPDPTAIYMSRRYGALFLGYAVILSLSRTAPASPARTAILAGSLVVTVAITIVSLVGVLAGTVGPAVWAVAAIEALLAVGFGYFYAKAPKIPRKEMQV